MALNHAVSLAWTPIVAPPGQFDHYAIYRATAAFTSVVGMSPIGTDSSIGAATYVDSTAANGTSYYYAVTSVVIGGGQVTTVSSIGPRTPHDETDLQVLSIARSPQYPRYAANYTYYSLSEPSGFGPYNFSASTSLGGGQTFQTQRFPNIGDQVTYTATIRNRGTNSYISTLSGTWRVDNAVVATPSQAVNLAPGQTATFNYVRAWDNQSHTLDFTLDATDARSGNNQLTSDTLAIPFLTYVDQSFIETFREVWTPLHTGSRTDDVLDWLNAHMSRFNAMFAAAGCDARVHYNVLEVIADSAPDPAIDRSPYAIFPFRYRSTDGDPRTSGYYHNDDDIDYGLLHEMGHQLGLIDIYRLEVPAAQNQVSGLGYNPVNCLMRTCAPLLSEHSALAMQHWLHDARGYFGQYLYDIPQTLQLRILGVDGQPLSGATVKMYQCCDRPGLGKVISTQVKAQGTTDANGLFVLPNVPIDTTKIPVVGTGDELHPNPFGYLHCVGTNGVLHFSVEYNGGVDYAWLDITEANVAYWHGQQSTAVFDRQLDLGVQRQPPEDMTELNSRHWSAWAEGATASVQDDTSRKQTGASSLKFTTTGGFDTYVRYPRTFTAQWDLSGAHELKFRCYAENPNIGFQNGSPWIRLVDANGNYFQYQYYQNGSPYDLLNDARGNWRSYRIPLDAPADARDGWRRTTSGTSNLTNIQFLELHSDTWEYGFTLWLDGIGFDLLPEITVLDGTAEITSGQPAPVYIGFAQQGDPPPSKTFTIRNDGNQPLTLTTPFADLPHFIVGEPGQTTLAYGETTTFTVSLKTDAVVDTCMEEVCFASNDADNGDGIENPFRFVVVGRVYPYVPIIRTWDGGGDNGDWTTSTNWTGDAAARASDSLQFPGGASRTTNTNNFQADTPFNSLTFTGGSYVISGNRIVLNLGIFNSIPIGQSNQLALDVHFTSATTSVTANGGTLNVSDAISTSGTVVKTGTGTLIISGQQNWGPDAVLQIGGSGGSSSVAGEQTAALQALEESETLLASAPAVAAPVKADDSGGDTLLATVSLPRALGEVPAAPVEVVSAKAVDAVLGGAVGQQPSYMLARAAELAWLDELERRTSQRPAEKKDNSIQAAVEAILATYWA